MVPDAVHPELSLDFLPEIVWLADDPNPDAPSILANGLWYKYRSSLDWGLKVWANTITSLQRIKDTAKQHSVALRYAQFLLHVDQHIPNGIDGHVLRWCQETGKEEFMEFTLEGWDVFSVVFSFLCAHGALSTPTVLSGLVYPAWQLCANANVQEFTPSVFIQAANRIFDTLVLQVEAQISTTIPFSLADSHRIHSWRQDAFREPHFSLLASEMPTLLLIEYNDCVPFELRSMVHDLRVRTCESREFRQGAHRDLDVIRKAFEQPIQSGSIGEAMFEPLVNALKVILSDSSEHPSLRTSAFPPDSM